MRPRHALAALLSLLCAACVIPLTDDEVGVVIRRIADAGPEARVMTFFSSSQSEAWVRVVEARSNGPLSESRQLAKAFEGAVRGRLHYVVGGPYAVLNDQLLVDAFELCKESSLPGLEVTLVSPDAPGDAVLSTARAYGARLTHRLYDDGR